MRTQFALLAGLAVLCPALVAGPVGVPAASVTIPLESATVDESAIRASVSPASPSQGDLLRKAQSTDLSETERLASLDQIQDQDAIFQLIFKPGSDTNLAVRIAAVWSLAELDVLWYLKAKCQDERVSAAASARLVASGVAGSVRNLEQCKRTVRAYARRMYPALVQDR